MGRMGVVTLTGASINDVHIESFFPQVDASRCRLVQVQGLNVPRRLAGTLALPAEDVLASSS